MSSTMSICLEQHSETAVQAQVDNFKIIVDRPQEKGGGGQGLMGGQHLLIGIGGCFCSTFFAAAQAREVEVKDLKVEVSALLSEDLPKRFTNVTLTASYGQCSAPEEFAKLLRIAESGCISVNTVKKGMALEVIEKERS